MNWSIILGGILVMLAVFGIFVFILGEIVPLFKKAKVDLNNGVKIESLATKDMQANPAIGVDEWGEMPFIYYGGKTIRFADITKGNQFTEVALPITEGQEVTSYNYNAVLNTMAIAQANGDFHILKVKHAVDFDTGVRRLTPKVEKVFSGSLGDYPAQLMAFGLSDKEALIVAVMEVDGKQNVTAFYYKQSFGLMGGGGFKLKESIDMGNDLDGLKVSSLLVQQNAKGFLLGTQTGEILAFKLKKSKLALTQRFYAFESEVNNGIRIDAVLGSDSIVVSDEQGKQVGYSLYKQVGNSDRSYIQTKTFDSFDHNVGFFSPSTRNKSFITGSNDHVVIRYFTTEAQRWEAKLPYNVVATAIDDKAYYLFFLSDQGDLYRYSLDDPHPEAGFKAFFGKVWYEGKSEPVYDWQSTGGSNEFESKLSLVPLFFGSIKGTFYSLIFAIPIALLAAIYSASFLDPRVKKVVKPTMEIMASLPSVVLGFLAALWLAPIIEHKVPSIILVIIGWPLLSIIFGFIWFYFIPIQIKNKLNGWEWLVLVPFMLFVAWVLWSLGGVWEQSAFIVQQYNILDAQGMVVQNIIGRHEALEFIKMSQVVNPDVQLSMVHLGDAITTTGVKMADFSLWWTREMGWGNYDQRNSLVVGFMMGFAVIPIIFTISEDALSNVPTSLKSASAALGATRWQTVRTIVMPIASAGIFSAIMIGFGRAVGETMIVVMATGNTPIMEWNIFNGMRTLSANIAVELPEAAKQSTHYRALFLGAFLLFMLTFIVNTIAEILRQHLRNKYKLV